MVVTRTCIDPDRLLNRGANDNRIVTSESIYDDGEKIPLRRKNVAQQIHTPLREAAQRTATGLGIGSIQCLQIQQRIFRLPQAISVVVNRVEVQLQAGGKGEVAVVLRQPRHEVAILQQSRLGDVIDVNFVVG